MQSEARLNARQLAAILKRRSPVILLCLVVIPAVVFAFESQQRKKYTATATLLFTPNSGINQQAAGLQPISTVPSQSTQDTNVNLVQLGDMASKTAAALGHGLTRLTVQRMLAVAAVGDTNLVSVSVTSASPTLAAEVANTYSDIFVSEQEGSNQQYYAAALSATNHQLAHLSPAQRNSSAGLTLEERAQSLSLLAELPSNTVQTAQRALVPTAPSSPKTRTNTIEAAAFGLLLGLGLTILLERFDFVIRDPKELERLYRLPLLGVIPFSASFSHARRPGAVDADIEPVESEAFQLVHAHLRYFNVDREVRQLLVTSAMSGAGKTTIVCHLAAAAARLGSQVLVIEADLRRPTMSPTLALRPGPGLAHVLIGAVPVTDAVQTVTIAEPGGAEGDDTRLFHVLAAGTIDPPNPAELVQSHAMLEVIQYGSDNYDLVLIDTPPITAVSDAFGLLKHVDGVIVVGRLGHDRRDVVGRAHETLEGVGAPLLGVIANGARLGNIAAYGYDYSYASAGSRSA